MVREYDASEEANENVDLTSDLTSELTLDGKDLDFEGEGGFGDDVSLSELEQIAKKAKAQGGRFSLKARRAIEDHLEERRLRKEMDYLFDDDFSTGNGEE